MFTECPPGRPSFSGKRLVLLVAFGDRHQLHSVRPPRASSGLGPQHTHTGYPAGENPPPPPRTCAHAADARPSMGRGAIGQQPGTTAARRRRRHPPPTTHGRQRAAGSGLRGHHRGAAQAGPQRLHPSGRRGSILHAPKLRVSPRKTPREGLEQPDTHGCRKKKGWLQQPGLAQ